MGRKLRVPWLGPYRVTEVHSTVSYGLTSEAGNRCARVHVNRLKKIAEDEPVADAGDPQQGIWPDVRRVIRSIIEARGSGAKLQFKVRSQGRNGFKWTDAANLPDVVPKAHEMAAGEKALQVVDVAEDH